MNVGEVEGPPEGRPMAGRIAGEPPELARALRRAGSAAKERADGSGPTDAPISARAAARAARRVAERAVAEGLADVVYAPLESPFGTLLAAATKRGLVRLAFPEESLDAVLEPIARRISARIIESPGALESVGRALAEYFDGELRRFELPLDWSLVGPFGRRVLGVTSEIPYGAVLSYAQVASGAGSARGSRAAGNALGANPIPIVVPCHRVLRSGGALGGYGGGLERKRWLLELEGAPAGVRPG